MNDNRPRAERSSASPLLPRLVTILFSLFVTAAVLCFIWLAPAIFAYPLDAAGGDSARLIQIVLPVFLGYLGAGSYLFAPQKAPAGTETGPGDRKR